MVVTTMDTLVKSLNVVVFFLNCGHEQLLKKYTELSEFDLQLLFFFFALSILFPTEIVNIYDALWL